VVVLRQCLIGATPEDFQFEKGDYEVSMLCGRTKLTAAAGLCFCHFNGCSVRDVRNA
jgi:hypothetical protein